MGLFDFLRPKQKQNLYSGGDGSTLETAVSINSSRGSVGIPAEYQYVIGRHGQKNDGWTLESQSLMENAGRHYDLLKIKLRNGESRLYYFDISQFYGRV